MQELDGELVLSATDVLGVGSCVHRAFLDREVASGLRPKPRRDNPMAELLGRLGLEHERSQLAELAASAATVVEISAPAEGAPGLRDAEARTLAALRAGADVVFQATFFDPPWRGHADFLVRVETPSELGSWSYEVADAKLHRKATKRDWLQVAFYSEQLARLQGHLPDMGHVFLGDGSQVSEPVAGHLEGVRDLQGRLIALISDPQDAPAEPNPSCNYCRWEPECQAHWRAEGHLSILGVRAALRQKLRAAGVGSITAVADADLGVRVDGVPGDDLRKIRSDARLYLYEQRTGVPHLRLRYPRDGFGLSMLPPPADGDMFLDLEGYPFGTGGAIEYLWGLVVREAGHDTYHRWWSHTSTAEELSFAEVVAFVERQLAADPERRVYHYNTYEATAFRRLAARVGGDVGSRALHLVDAAFVDLLPIARWSVRTSSMSSGLKALERFYRSGRTGDVTDAAGSVLDYAAWLDDKDDKRLEAIERYNRVDCESLADLRDWLLRLAADVREARVQGTEDPQMKDAAELPDLRERLVAAAALPDGGPLLRRTLVALDYEEGVDAAEVSELIGRTVSDVGALLARGKKELGLPLSVAELQTE